MRFLFKLIFVIVTTNSFAQNISFDKFQGIPIETSFIREISQSMFIYVDNSYTEAKTDDQLSYIQNILEFEKDRIKSIFRYSFSNENKKYSIYKFSVINEDSTSNIYTKLHLYEDNQWKEEKNPLGSVKYLFDIFKTMNLSFYKLLISNDKKPGYDIINELKSYVSTKDGILNIEKLYKFINQNKNSMESFLEE